ncbi:MAG: rod shape-determining protein RodA [Flavobacteriales bacterium]|nr:rod shape-determining protein RodA [Flavobacteriales bacterium]
MSSLGRQHPLANVDWLTVLVYGVLVIFGWMNIYSAAVVDTHPNPMDMSQEYGKQFLFILISSFLGLMVLYMEGEFFNKFAIYIYGLFILLLLLVLAVGTTVNGAKAWIQIGGFALQPAEFAKIGVGLMLAKYISNTKAKFNNWKTRLIAAVIIGIPALLILVQPDVGSLLTFVAFILALYREGLSGNVLIIGLGAIVFGVLSIISGFNKVNYPFFGEQSGVFILMTIVFIIGIVFMGLIKNFVVPRNRKKLYLITILSTVAAIGFSFSVNFMIDKVLAKHQKTRIYVTLGLEEKEEDRSEMSGDSETAEAADMVVKSKSDDPGYNARMAKIAVGNGGFFGQGYRQGPMTKNKYVPERWTDFIFSVISEEWGFVGSVAVIGLFVFLIVRLINMAERQRSQFSRVYGYCVASIFFLHLLINVGMVIGLAPIIGIPLPFMSYGGSSLIGFTLLLFIFLRLDAERLSVFR